MAKHLLIITNIGILTVFISPTAIDKNSFSIEMKPFSINRQSFSIEGERFSFAPNVNGNNELRWNRNGDKPNTIFVIEAQIGEATEWTYVDSTAETKYTHTNQKPGTQIAYRVKATRKGESSPWSAVAVAYFKG